MRSLAVLLIPLLLPWLACAQPSYDFAEVERILAEAQTRLNTPLTLILTQHGQVIYNRSFGATTPSASVAIASGSKWLSAAVVMSVVDSGQIALDHRLSRFIPSFSGDKAPITLRQAFSHTAGFPPETALEPETPCLIDRATTLEACTEQIARVPLVAAPGAAFAYGSLSMQAAGRALEVATGRSFSQLFQDRLVRPLGLTGTITGFPGRDANPLVAGGFASTALDYTRVLRMYLQGGVWEGQRVLSPRSVVEMLRDQTFGARIASSPYLPLEIIRPGIGQTRYGIGNWLERSSGGAVLENSSQGAFGFSPWLDYDRNLTGVLMVRDSLSAVLPYYWRLKTALAAAIPLSPLSPRGIVNAASYQGGAVSPGQWITLFGNFAGANANSRVLVDGAPVPVLYVLPNQIAAQIPATVAGRAAVQVSVEIAPGNRTPAVPLAVEAAWPGLFSADASGSGPAAALNQDNSLNSSSRPAAPGSIVVLFGTGLGPGAPTVRIGGQPAPDVLYAAQAPGVPNGFFQLNVRVPAGLPPGSHPIVIESAGIPSQPNLTIAVGR